MRNACDFFLNYMCTHYYDQYPYEVNKKTPDRAWHKEMPVLTGACALENEEKAMPQDSPFRNIWPQHIKSVLSFVWVFFQTAPTVQ